MRSWVLRSPQRREEGFALEVEEVLLADERAGGDAAAGEDVGGPAGDFLVVFGGIAGLAHEEDAGFHEWPGRPCRARGSACAGCGAV